MTHILSGFILLCLLWGRTLHGRRRGLHMVVMTAVIFADIALVLYLALGREVLSKVKMTMPLLLYIHITLAVSVVVLYLLALWTGIALARKRSLPLNRLHMRRLDQVIVPMRIGTFVTSLMLSYW